MSIPQLAHAKLIPIIDGEPAMADAIEVQFNPASLKVNLANNLRAAEDGADTQAQYIESSSSTLAIELLFDSTANNTDVRLKTIKIAEAFMKPGEDNLAPGSCLFQWGSFSFEGMLQGFDETLDYFAPEGIPLRSTLSMNFAENAYQFRIDKGVSATRRELPTFTPANASAPIQSGNGESQRSWRETALFNGIESPRFPGLNLAPGTANSLSRPSKSTQAEIKRQRRSGKGFSIGASNTLGSTIPGAFKS